MQCSDAFENHISIYFWWFWEAFGSFWAPKVNILGSESDTENMSGFYAENEHPSGGTPPFLTWARCVWALTKHTFYKKNGLPPAREAKIGIVDFQWSLESEYIHFPSTTS